MSRDADYRKINDRSQNSSTYHKKDGTALRAKLKQAAQREAAPDLCPCGGCRRLFPHWKVDAVLLDEEGNRASAEAYCADCWPKFKRVACDEFREGDPS